MTFPSGKLSQRFAQNVLEFSLILALVAGGIILGAPYVRRSWNAYLKSLEEGIDDSHHDPFDRGYGVDMACSCGAVYGQPPDTCGFGPCSVFSYRRARDCFPFGCDDDLNECIVDPLCCTDWIQDDCGTRVTHADPCKQNEMAYWKKCGDGKIYSKCVKDERCGVSCYGEIDGQPADPNSKGWCFPGEYDAYLKDALPVYYVDSNGCPPSAYEAQCVAECKPGFKSTGTACVCEPRSFLIMVCDDDGKNTFESWGVIPPGYPTPWDNELYMWDTAMNLIAIGFDAKDKTCVSDAQLNAITSTPIPVIQNDVVQIYANQNAQGLVEFQPSASCPAGTPVKNLWITNANNGSTMSIPCDGNLFIKASNVPPTKWGLDDNIAVVLHRSCG